MELILSNVIFFFRGEKSRWDGSNIGVMLNLIGCVELKVQHPLFQGIAGLTRNDGASKAPNVVL